MSIYKSINGMVELSITSADPALTLMQISKLGITVYDSRIEEDLITLRFCLNRQDVKAVKKMANRKDMNAKLREEVASTGILEGCFTARFWCLDLCYCSCCLFTCQVVCCLFVWKEMYKFPPG